MANEFLMFVGTLNREVPYFQGARGDGLHVLAFDENTLSARPLAHFPQVENPTFLSCNADGSRIYVNSEVSDWREGLVTAFGFDRETSALRYLNAQPTLGSIPAQNMISRDGKRLFLANYTVWSEGPDQSFVIFDIRADGSLSPAIASVAHQGDCGPVTARQDRSHAHSATETVAGGVVLVADLGLDQLVAYRIASDGLPQRIGAAATAPGAGPRHVALHPNGRFAYVMNELGSSVAAYGLDAASGALQAINTLPAVPEDSRNTNHCSDIQISPDGRFVYGANRGHDSIAIFAVDPETGTLSAGGFVPCGGATPRHMALTPSGRHLLSANQNADRITIFARDAETGALSETGRFIALGTPMCVQFAAQPL
ncbi:lactonase family protein [Xinfangfangia sp. D13-10-4-6]|uniref:lactonase family protein n=1 Tax=Pseudogemmobacter hezensis TaxID=2737662 RepID=UPI00155435A9|nr:lactonase family protein [Pseudogemmobacter hezensis]NPD16802.1 lactonase family protein [Pseudogemmobacter hezensis]